ncbi:tetratricopeptide repeat protein [Flavobacterium amniphilum]|uniref:tetratricopeptide repeat protein n=1 Tax=Flavobacterium amniphilum TaxID=1834035 RepID=UPI00202A0EED|nr:tetratricopeptide repeat protein [Flavobacterium amniphilum]MCL9806989.1 tetratricopeptide repeat protein [Flavobacterium amniphilum]
MIVLNNIAILYSKEKKFNKATDYFLKAYLIAKDDKDQLKIGLYGMNLGNLENDKNNPKKARKYFAESLPLLKKYKQYLVMAEI